MKYNLALSKDAELATDYLVQLIDKQKLIEIKTVSPGRTLNQNSYLHLILASFGEHFGYTLEESKQLYKRMNQDCYYYSKKVGGKTVNFLRSSADLTVDEMKSTIDKFRQVSEDAGFPLPLATNKEWLIQIENQIEQSRYK